MAGGGYVLSREALRKFKVLLKNTTLCFVGGMAEDLEMGKCLTHSAIFVDCRDDLKEKRFFPVSILEHIQDYYEWWYTTNQYYNSTHGSLKCCSEKSIAFHYIFPREFYKYEYYIHKVALFGLEPEDESLPRKLTLDEIIAASDVSSSSKHFKNLTRYHNLK